MPIHERSDRAIVRFSGEDAQKLLNDVLTAKFDAASKKASWWALLSPQGKIQAEGLAAWHDDGFYLDLHRDAADAFIKRMSMYRLRAKVEIADLRKSHAVGFAAENTEGKCVADARLAELGYRVIAERDAASGWAEATLYHSVRAGLGVPEVGADYPADELFPHDMGMDLLSGVDFAKGCYVGQEVVSRMQHRGTARRRPVIVSGSGLEAGAALMCGGKETGTLGQVAADKAVAIVRLDRVTGALDCVADGVPVQLALPFWARYDFADSAGAPESSENG